MDEAEESAHAHVRGLPRDEAQDASFCAWCAHRRGRSPLDLTGHKSGRGAYVCRSQDCLQRRRSPASAGACSSRAPVSDAVRDALMAQLPDLPAPEDTDAADE